MVDYFPGFMVTICAIAVLVWTIGISAGWQEDRIQEFCDDFGRVELNDKWYECAPDRQE